MTVQTIDPDEVADVIAEGSYICPTCGANMAAPEWGTLLIRCHGVLVELTAPAPRPTRY